MDGRLKCTWCGNAVEPDDGYRLGEHAGDRGAVFCRLEHVVPWAIQGPIGRPASRASRWARPPRTTSARTAATSSQDTHLLLVRHRAEHRIPDRFCNVAHLLEWAKEGGRWR